MLFNTLSYAAFLGAAFSVSWVLTALRAHRARLLFLLGASYFFYAHWDLRFLPLIWASSTIDFWLAQTIASASSERRRKALLVITVAVNLGVLGFFKYAGFGLELLRSGWMSLGLNPGSLPTAFEIALPVGISFFTFESMSYVIDVYRRELEPHKSYTEYLTFVAFFPHLVAGPIVRPKDLLPALARPASFQPLEAQEGLFLIALGLSKKIVIGDYLALNLVDRVFDAPLQFSSLEVYAAIIGYALQIYCDFSGYTDIAIGSALLFGIRFPLNFASPYQAANIVDFWRRWHISLSTWLRDYLYIPLGGNRRGPLRTYFNLLATMLLGGLWHGPSLTFVAWGGMHGAALALHRLKTQLWERWFPGSPAPSRASTRLLYPLKVAFTFHFVCACWVFFRADSFSAARTVFRRLFDGTLHHPNLPGSVVCVLALGLFTHYLPEARFEQLKRALFRLHYAPQGLLLFGLLLLLRKLASKDAVPFVYFQF